MKANIYEQITSQIIEQLENGIIPWQKPWINTTGAGCISHTSGKPYSLLNQWLLGGRTGEWLTYAQVQKEGGRIKAGEKASLVVFWTWLEKKETKTRTKVELDADGNEVEVTDTYEVLSGGYPVLKGYNVFHIDQCEGIKARYNNEVVKFDNEPNEIAEQVIADYIEREGVKLEIQNGDRACYSPMLDRIRVPELAQYEVAEEYYSTLFHEITHSTGHAKRLNREGVAAVHFFGDDGYSKEELVAEIGAAYMCNRVGIECEKAFRNSVGYIQGWLKELRNDKRLIVSAAAKAEAAAKYIMDEK